MKKISQRVTSIIISMIILLSSLTCAIGVLADTAQSSHSNNNLLSELIPQAFAVTAQGSVRYKWGMIRTENADSNKIWGYDLLQPDHTGAYTDERIEYLKPLTDGKTDKSIWLQPENAWDINNESLYDDMYLIYELSEKTNLSGFSFNTSGAFADKNIDVYAAGTYAELFKNKVTTVSASSNDDTVSGTLATVASKYIAFVLKTPGYFVSEIEVYSADIALEPDITFTKANLVKGKMPIVYSSSNPGGNGYNWTETKLTPDGPFKFGYSIPIKQGITGVDTWKEYLTKLTDDNFETSQWIQPMNAGNDFVIVYEFDAAMLEGFMLDAKGGAVNGTVYASESYDNLFNEENAVAQLNKSSAAVRIKRLTSVKAKYLAFVFNNAACYINEIAIYGTSDTAQELTFTSENAIKGKMPIVYSSSNPGGNSYNWTEIRTSPDNNAPGLKFGYSIPMNQGAEPIAIESWKPYLTRLTDEDNLTGQWIQPGRIYNPYDDFVIVYRLDELKTLEGFKFESICKDVRVKIYASKTYNTLFSKKSLIDQFEVTDYIGNVEKRIDCAAEYVALVFEEAAFVLNEFSVYAKEYVKPDYGDNLILNKKPMSVYISNREYPLGSNGLRMWAYDPEKNSNEISMVEKTLYMLTDDDFTASKDWLHDNGQKYVENDSPYWVLAWDLGSISTLNKILVDSNLGGFDIYISEKFNDLYDEGSRIWSSGGDRVLADGKLDPATDLEPGEELIDVSGIRGRYVAFVITRTSQLGAECWNAIAIREIQVYGIAGTNEIGSNLIRGKKPIFNYRAEYSDYSIPVQQMKINEADAGCYTNGVYITEGYIQYPNSGGALLYRNGAGVLIYYLDGTCDVKGFAMHSGIYYGPGGIDVFVSDKFDTLFDKQNQMYTSGGETATEGIYDVSKNLGSRYLSITFDKTKRGRYVAFVITRTYDVGTYGASGILRLAELELFGDFISTERLPETTVTDESTGNIAVFNYVNPDDSFKFAAKGIATFRFTSAGASVTSSEKFKMAMLQNNFKAVGEAFKIEFLDRQGNVIPSSELADESITFDFMLNSDELVRLGEIRNNSVYVIREAQQYGKKLTFTTEEYDRYLYIMLKFDSKDAIRYNGFAIGDETDTENTDATDRTDGTDNIKNGNNQTGGNTVTDINSNAASNGSINKNSQKDSNKRKWVVVDADDPFEWFWNIYDTFAANIWMLILCITVFVLCIGGITTQIVIYKKRRNK